MHHSAAGPVFEAKGALVLFGQEPRPATLALFQRARGWRLRRTIAFAAAGLILAPIVVLAPPHVPWLLAALVGGGTMAWRSWNSRFAVVGLDGDCPHCGAELTVRSGSRLVEPLPLTCGECHYELVLELEPDQLPAS